MISYKKWCAIQELSFVRENRIKNFIRNYNKQSNHTQPQRKISRMGIS